MKLTKSDPRDELIQEVVNLVRRLKQHHSNPERPFSFVQMQVMWFLRENEELMKDDPTMSGLADYLGIKPATCSQLIERLVETKLVKREVDRQDRRIVRVGMTPKGLSELNIMKNQKLEELKDLLSDINKDDLAALKRAIEQINRKLGGVDE